MRFWMWFLTTFLGWQFASVVNSSEPAQIYQQKCANCHGADGQGVTGVYETALSGPRSISELTRLIERTMPEGEVEQCVGEEAAQVAEYLFHEFYSPAARARKGLDPAITVEFSRMTVAQYRNAMADVIGHFTPMSELSRTLPPKQGSIAVSSPDAAPPTDGGGSAESNGQALEAFQPGLNASYFGSKGMSKADHLAHSGIDHHIDFDFGEKAPYEGMPDDQFAIIWNGALVVEDSGEYSLRVTTSNGARVYLNLDPSKGLHKLRDDSGAAGQAPLIDAWVGSGQVREETARVYLLGGRRYPIRIEFFKYQEPTASLRLEWKPPHGVWSILDERNLTTAEVGRTFVVDTVFPADDRSAGFERGASITPEWYAAVTAGAVEAAEEVVSRLPLLAGDQPGGTISDADADLARKQRLQEFIVQFASVAFRRTIDEQQAEQLKERPFDDQASVEAAVRRAIAWVFCSPEFLYADMAPSRQSPPQHTIARRLALALWDSIPDAKLMASAEAGQLSSPQEVESEARRMLDDLRTRHKLRGFFHHWLHLEERDLTKDQRLYSGFDQEVFADLKHSLDLFLEHVVWSPSSDYRQLLTSPELWANVRLQELFRASSRDERLSESAARAEGLGSKEKSVFKPVLIDGEHRAGVLTHPYLLSALAYHNNTSPIHRGVFVTRNVLGRSLRAPPVAIAFENDEFPPDLTMRQKVAHLTQDASCLSCHTIINPLGFSLENYDAVGRWRDTENGIPIDSISDYETEDGEVVRLTGPRDIAELAVSSKAAHRAFVQQLFQHLTKQAPAAYGPDVLADLVDAFEEDQFHIQNLMVRIAVMASRHGVDSAPIAN